MLAELVDHVIGVDTHRDSHTAAVLDTNGRVLEELTVPADAFGHRKVLRFGVAHAPARRAWAIEGTGSFGAGLTTYLLEHGEWVVEVDRPARPARRNGAKSDELDAARAAKEALSREHLAQPRRRGCRPQLDDLSLELRREGNVADGAVLLSMEAHPPCGKAPFGR